MCRDVCPPWGLSPRHACRLGTHSQWGIRDLARGMCPNTSPKPGFGVQLAEMQCGGCPSHAGNARGGYAPGGKGKKGGES